KKQAAVQVVRIQRVAEAAPVRRPRHVTMDCPGRHADLPVLYPSGRTRFDGSLSPRQGRVVTERTAGFLQRGDAGFLEIRLPAAVMHIIVQDGNHGIQLTLVQAMTAQKKTHDSPPETTRPTFRSADDAASSWRFLMTVKNATSSDACTVFA